MAYEGCTLCEETAKELFAPHGRSCDAVLEQAVPIVTADALKHRLEGPADTGCAGLAAQRVVAVDGAGAEECDEDSEADPAEYHAPLPDQGFPEEVAPPLHI